MTACVDAVIVTYNSADTVEDAITSVRRCSSLARVIVVDNASTDGSANVARAAEADAVIESGGNLGFAAGVNLGLRQAHAEYLLLLNPDAAIEPENLEALIGALEREPEAVFAGPVLLDGEGGRCLGARRFSTLSSRLLPCLPVIYRFIRAPEYAYGQPPRDADGVARVDYLWGAALLARRGFLADIGGLDERFFMYSEDEDLGLQARTHGRSSLLVSEATAHHIGALSSAGRRDLVVARQIKSNALLFEKWRGVRRGRAYMTLARAALVLQGLSAVVRNDRLLTQHIRSVLRHLGSRGEE